MDTRWVAPLGERVGDPEFKFANLIAAVSQARVAVLAFGPDARATQMLGEALQPVDRARPEHQRIPGKVSDRHARQPTVRHQDQRANRTVFPFVYSGRMTASPDPRAQTCRVGR
jgi:hypothetical protein